MITGSGAVGWKEYLITAAILSGVGLILQLLMYFKGKEEYKVNASSAMSFKEMFRELKSNRMIQIVLVTYLWDLAGISACRLRCRRPAL